MTIRHPLSYSCPVQQKSENFYTPFKGGMISTLCPKVLSGYFFTLIGPFCPKKNKPNEPFGISLDKNNIDIVNQLAIFGKTLERYHPGKAKKLLATFKQQYEDNKENLIPLKEEHKKTLKEFIEIHQKFLEINRDLRFPPERIDKINKCFENFSNAFKALISSYDPQKLKEASSSLDEFNRTIMQSDQLHIELDKVISYIENQNILFLRTFEEQFNPAILHTLKNHFAPTNPKNQGFNQIIEYNAQRSGLLDLIADASVILQALLPKTKSDDVLLLKNDLIKNDLLKTIQQKGKELVSLIKADKENHKKGRETMRFCLKDTEIRDSCKTLEKNLEILLKEQPYLFTKREKKALDRLQKDLSVISYGKVFKKKDLQEQLNQCQDIIKELLPKQTSFSQIISSLYILDFSIKGKKIELAKCKEIIDLLNSFINDSKIPFQFTEKEHFIKLREALLSITHGQAIPENETADLSQKIIPVINAIKEIKKRPPSKEENKLAIEQEIQKLAKHTTTLSFMMLIDKALFNSNRDFLFYRNIIQKSEKASSCPKKLLLAELKAQGFSTWKIVSAKVYFFVTKHLKIENYVHKLISRVMTNYSKIIYQKLDQEHNQDQFRSLGQKIVENATMYFQLLGSATSKAKKNAQELPNQITQLIVEQLLLLKPEENEVTLKELNLNDLYSKLIDDLVEKSESRLLRWVAPWLDKHKLISSIIEIGTDSLINPAPNGNASLLNLFIRDGLKMICKKLQQLKEGSRPEEVLPPNPSAKALAESFIYALNEHRAIQQVASYTKIIVANNDHLEKLKKQISQLEGVGDQSITNLEETYYNMMLKLDFLKSQALQKEKRQSLSIYPIIQTLIKTPLKMLENLLPHLETPEEKKFTLLINEVVNDKIKTNIRSLIDDRIKKNLTYLFTKLLSNPPSEELIYDLIYQNLAMANQAIECPKENKETQAAVEEEISELVNDISFFRANKIPLAIAKSLTDSNSLSKLAEKIPYDVPSLIAPVIQERLQDIISLTGEKFIYQPELIAQLGRRLFLPGNAA